jgi:hypothetical protein
VKRLRYGIPVFVVAWVLLLWMAPPLTSYLTNPDHGYQLSLGRLITLGAFPFVDLIFHYGPMVALTSAWALWCSGGLLGETIVCATGYAAALGCLAEVARARAGRIAGFLVPLVGLVFLARFYKWYFWLFPALALLLLHRYLARDAEPLRGLFTAGLTAGLCALYRLDLGVVLLILWCIVAVTGPRGLVQARFPIAILRVAVGFAAPVATWLVALAASGGTAALRSYGAATFDGGRGVVAGWSHGAAPFDASHLLSPASALWIALLVVPLCLLGGLALGSWQSRSAPADPRGDARFLAGASLLGIGLLPQALYRADPHHLLQALPPFLVVAPLLARQLSQELEARSHGWRHLGRLAVAAIALATLLSGIGLRSFGGKDLAPLASNGFERLADLAAGLTAPKPRYPISAAMWQLAALTPPDGRILVVPMSSQIYYFAERPMSGLLNIYAPSILSDPFWRERNLEHVREHPPEAILVRSGFVDPESQNARKLRASFPELEAFLRSRYTRVAFRRGPWTILQRPEGTG